MKLLIYAFSDLTRGACDRSSKLRCRCKERTGRGGQSFSAGQGIQI